MLLARPMAPLLILTRRSPHLRHHRAARRRADCRSRRASGSASSAATARAKSTLLKIAAGLVEPDSGERFFQPGATIRYLPQEPDFSGFATLGDFVRAGLAPGDDPQRVGGPAARGRAHRRREARPSLRRRGAARGTGARAGARARRAAARRADEPSRPCRPSNGWRASSPRCARRWCSSAMTGASSRGCRARRCGSTAGARARLDQGFAQLRGMARRDARAGRDRPPQARPHDRRRARLGALRRQRAAQAQPGAPGGTHGAAPRAQRTAPRRGRRQARSGGRREFRHARRQGVPRRQSPMATGRREAISLIRMLKGNRVGVVGANGSGKTTLVNLLTGTLEPEAAIGEARHQCADRALDQDRAQAARRTPRSPKC